MDIKEILKNEHLQSLIKKTGVSEQQVESVVKQAVASLGGKFKENPKQMSSLLSSNPNTEDDEVLAKEVENDFLSNLIKKVGLPESTAGTVKGLMPEIMKVVTSKMDSKGENSESGMASLFNMANDLFDSKSKKGGLMGFIGSFFKK